MLRVLTIALALAAGLAGSQTATAASLPPVKHVFVIVLENENADSTFGKDSKAPYLAHELTKLGQFLPEYYGTVHNSLGNYIAMVSGQAATIEIQADCQFYRDVFPALPAADGQVVGQGCVYPSSVKTVANQLVEKGLTWKGYMQDMKQPCQHPDLNSQDHTQSAQPGAQYAARHNPFVYFHSIIDTPDCAKYDVPLTQLEPDLASAQTTPSFSFITPDLCEDGHDEPCVDGRPGGLVSADAFLTTWVPKILASPAYKQGGLLLVTFDEAESSDDASACCNEQAGPNTPNPGALTLGPGGGRVGMVAISQFIAPGSENKTPYNHYSFLRSVEDVFGLGHLGYAAVDGLKAFGDDVFNGPDCFDRPVPAGSGPLEPGTLVQRFTAGGRTAKLRLWHGAKVSVKSGSRRIGPKRPKACKTYSIRLRKAHGKLVLRATSAGRTESRTLRY